MDNELDRSLSYAENDISKHSLDFLKTDIPKIVNMFVEGVLKGQIAIDVNNLNRIRRILNISDIIYNNSTEEVLLLDDGIYDLLITFYKKFDPNYKVGADVVYFQNVASDGIKMPTEPFRLIPDPGPNAIYTNDIDKYPSYMPEAFGYNILPMTEDRKRKDMVEIVPHTYNSLVGTLDKCKFTLMSEALNAGVNVNDPTITIFERDFLQAHIQAGIINPNQPITMVAELKYDGISIEAEVLGDRIISACTRGDTANDRAANMSHIFAGHVFPRAAGKVKADKPFGMKFEAIITKDKMQDLSRITKINYANPRNTVAGLLNSKNAYQYRELVTLVPLAQSMEVDRLTEIQFLNKYYAHDVLLNYAVLSGNPTMILYQLHKFVEEAYNMRPYMPFAYDGVVVSYVDPQIKQRLGRQNFINKYSIAIKFPQAIKLTRFRGIDYTVGSTGVITPMIMFDPVEFNGCIHDKASGHSYARLKKLNLRYNDIVQVEYTNDVLPYVRKYGCEENRNNQNPEVEIIDTCPVCGTKLIASEKALICPNMRCQGRLVGRIANAIKDLGIKSAGDRTISRLVEERGITQLSQVFTTQPEVYQQMFGINQGQKIYQNLCVIYGKRAYDYQLFGAVGFTNMGKLKWKKILEIIPYKDFLYNDINRVMHSDGIRDIGEATVETIINEMPIFREDLLFLCQAFNVVESFGNADKAKTVIRFSGISAKDKAPLIDILSSMGYDCEGTSITKKTKMLIIPHSGYTSTKTQNVAEDCLVVPIDDFKKSMEYYLGLI